jgi:hypothetical protein
LRRLFEFVAALGAFLDVGVDPSDVPARAVALVTIELLRDGHGEVGEVDVLILGTSPSQVTPYPGSRLISVRRT